MASDKDSELINLVEKCAMAVQRATSAIVAAGTIPETGNDDLETPDVSKHLQQLRTLANSYCHEMERAKLHSTASRILKETIDTDNDNLDGEIKKFKEIIESRCTNTNAENHPLMQRFNETVSAMEQNFDDSDLIQTDCFDQYIDPITKTQITLPVRNKICKHVYDKVSISEIIKRNPRARCPVVGCGNRQFLIMKDLHIDEELLLQLTQTQMSRNE